MTTPPTTITCTTRRTQRALQQGSKGKRLVTLTDGLVHCHAMKRRIFSDQCLLFARDLAVFMVLSTVRAKMCYARYAATC